ncbi:MAG: tetratricopeptide repeat protein [Pseudomonadota bacterium]
MAGMENGDTPELPLQPLALAAYREARRLHRAGDLHGGLQQFQLALRLGGEHPVVLEHLAMLAADGGDLPAAERILRRAYALGPAPAIAARLALAVHKQGRYADAVPMFEAVLPQISFNADFLAAYAFALEATGELARALSVREQVFRQEPTATQAVNLAVMLERLGEHARLATLLAEQLRIFPGNADLLGLAAVRALSSGDYPGGFALLGERLRLAGEDAIEPHLRACPLWDGQPFDGVLVLPSEVHLGEEIQLSSLLNDVVALSQPALVDVDARLLPLFRRAWPGLQFTARGSGELTARLQAGGTFRRAGTIDLVRLFSRTCVLPGAAAWLTPPEGLRQKKQAEYRARWPGKRRVGISWRSARLNYGMDLKSIPLSSLPATLSVPDTVFIDLQYGDFRADTDALAGTGVTVPWRDPDIDPTRDIDALAAQLCALDEVVLVSNTTAHLAGALGVPTTVLLPKHHPVLWHWGDHGEQTTWYGSVHLLRNPEVRGFGQLDRLLAGRLAGIAG